MSQFIMGLWCIGIGIITLSISPGEPLGYWIATLAIIGGIGGCLTEIITRKKVVKT